MTADELNEYNNTEYHIYDAIALFKLSIGEHVKRRFILNSYFILFINKSNCYKI